MLLLEATNAMKLILNAMKHIEIIFIEIFVRQERQRFMKVKL